MKFTFDRNAMINEISIAQEIISNKSTLTILSNVLFIAENNSLTIKATDIKNSFITKIPVDVDSNGSTTVYCDMFMRILSSIPEGEIEFNLKEKDGQATAVIRHTLKKVEYKLKCMSTEKFPDITEAEKVPFFDIPLKEFKSMTAQTSFAVSDDETRYFMNGVFFEKKDSNLVLVATDGRRLAYCSKSLLAEISDLSSAIVHPKILNIISRHSSDEGNISIAIVEKMIFIKYANYEFTSTLLDGQFPNYNRVIPESQKYKFTVLKSDMVNALKQASLMVDKKAGRIFLHLEPGVLNLSSQVSDLGDANVDIPCEFAEEPITLAMNIRYIEEPLKVINSENITFEYSEAMRAVTLRPEPAEDYFHIIMPMQMA